MFVLCKHMPWTLWSFVEKEITYSIVHEAPSRAVLNSFYLHGHEAPGAGHTFSYFLRPHRTTCMFYSRPEKAGRGESQGVSQNHVL